MGRWSHRKRMGGGPPTAAVGLTSMTVATIGPADRATVTYSAAITAGDFTPSDFASLPSTETGAMITQADVNKLLIEMTGSIGGDTDLQYIDSAPGILSPQTIAYS